MSSMKNKLLIPLILVVLLFVGATAFGLWAFMSREDYRTNVQSKIDAAVKVAQNKLSSEKDAEFAEREKRPLKEYKGPAAYGSVVIMYPKTWSAYVIEKNSGTPLDGFFNPSYVPDTTGNSSNFALRMQVLDTSYSQELKKYDSNVKSGKLKATPYVPAKVQSVTGMRFDGEVATGKTGAMVIVPMRDKTLKLWTESTSSLDDFNNIILPNYSFEQ